jgi:hypothetical protein
MEEWKTGEISGGKIFGLEKRLVMVWKLIINIRYIRETEICKLCNSLSMFLFRFVQCLEVLYFCPTN